MGQIFEYLTEKNCRTFHNISNYPHPIGLLFLVTILPLGAYLFRLGAHF
jgi:hypothetical protein